MAKKSTKKKKAKAAKKSSGNKKTKKSSGKRGRPKKANASSSSEAPKKRRGRPKRSEAPSTKFSESQSIAPDSDSLRVAAGIEASSQAAPVSSPEIDDATQPTPEMIAVGNSLKAIINSYRAPLRKNEIEELLSRTAQVYRTVASYENDGYFITISDGTRKNRVPSKGVFPLGK